jgi:hypothetical protein
MSQWAMMPSVRSLPSGATARGGLASKFAGGRDHAASPSGSCEDFLDTACGLYLDDPTGLSAAAAMAAWRARRRTMRKAAWRWRPEDVTKIGPMRLST